MNSKILCLFLLILAATTISCDTAKQATNSYTGALKAGNDAAVVSAIRNIQSAEVQYMATHEDEFGTFDQLVANGNLDSRFSGTSPVVGHYTFSLKLTPKSGSTASGYALNADPQPAPGDPQATGAHYYTDSNSSSIRSNKTASAGPKDPVI